SCTVPTRSRGSSSTRYSTPACRIESTAGGAVSAPPGPNQRPRVPALSPPLFNAGMPYGVYGGMRFFERAEIKHALAYLRLLAAPADDGAFLRVVNFPPRGIGARSLQNLQDAARGAGTSLWQAACTSSVGGKAGSSLAAFV